MSSVYCRQKRPSKANLRVTAVTELVMTFGFENQFGSDILIASGTLRVSETHTVKRYFR